MHYVHGKMYDKTINPNPEYLQNLLTLGTALKIVSRTRTLTDAQVLIACSISDKALRVRV